MSGLCLQLDGASFETADIADLNDWHGKLNSAWRNLADARLAVWHHLVRCRHEGYPVGAFRSAFAADLDAQYRARLARGQMFRKLLGRRLPQRIQARIDSPAGMAGLCAVEARLADCWAVEVSKEFVWLTRSPAAACDRLELRAFADGDVICEAVFRLGM